MAEGTLALLVPVAPTTQVVFAHRVRVGEAALLPGAPCVELARHPRYGWLGTTGIQLGETQTHLGKRDFGLQDRPFVMGVGRRRGTRGTRGCLVRAVPVGDELAVRAIHGARLRLKRDVPAVPAGQELAVLPKSGARLVGGLLETIDGSRGNGTRLGLLLKPLALAQLVS
jgi:hypothetical protein